MEVDIHLFADLLDREFTAAQRIEMTSRWIEEIVIGFDFCPFASRVFFRRQIVFRVAEHVSKQYLLQLVHIMCVENRNASKTIIIICQQQSFHTFLELIEVVENFLELSQLNQYFQLAHFHPHYQFANIGMEELSNYTNRSPFPCLHLLKVAEVAKAIEYFGDTTSIPHKNIRTLAHIDRKKLREKFLEMYL